MLDRVSVMRAPRCVRFALLRYYLGFGQELASEGKSDSDRILCELNKVRKSICPGPSWPKLSLPEIKG